MASRSGRSNQPPAPASNRQNEYFVPRDGIDREVITADICRYLGNDALVRPGVYESPQTNTVVQGYFITAYRNLTTAMIEDLKADSARWDQERRQSQTARNPVGGTIASREAEGAFFKKSNSPVVQYRNSDTHQSRQYYGPTEAPGAYSGDSARDFNDGPRYPGTGNGPYTGATSSAYSNQQYGNSGGYGSQQSYGSVQPQQFAPPPAASVPYSGGVAMPASGYQATADSRPYQMPVNHGVRGADTPLYDASDPYATGSTRVPATTMSQGRPVYVTTTGAPVQAGYTGPSAGSYYTQNPTAPNSTQFQQPHDPFYGRASPAGNPSYGSTHDQQYEPSAPRTSATSSSTQVATSGSSRRERERESDRHGDSRHRSHRSGHGHSSHSAR